MNKEKHFRNIIIKGVDLLEEQKRYKQIQIINKLKTLNTSIAPASLTNILKLKRVSLDLLIKTAEGIQEIIKSELGFIYVNDAYQDTQDTSFKAEIVKETILNQVIIQNDSLLPGFTFHTEGRVKIQDKTNFLQQAQYEIIEVGTRLRTFTDYFFSRNEQEFKVHIVNLLRQGVKMRFYMLDPDSNEARLYFNDRSNVLEEEKEAIDSMKKVIHRLKKVYDELADEIESPKFEVYLYKHVPNNHFLVLDAHRPNGKMMVSHYLYGIKRAECPVIEIDKQRQSTLFKKYCTSLQDFIKDAKLCIPTAKQKGNSF